MAVAFDYKKEYKELYVPARKPSIVEVPAMNYLAVRGKGDPNAEAGAYKESIGLLYAVAFTIKMSKKGDHRIDGYFDFVVPPLEGFWRQGEANGPIDYARKEDFSFISCIRLPDFVSLEDFAWAREEAARKKQIDLSKVELLAVEEGLCVQCMHIGPYDDEPATIERMDAFATAGGYAPDFSEQRQHHEIYLSDPRRCAPERLKTVIRHPVRAV
nr:GyrI-like domain-containing protein [Adlercreutzia sp. ZJ242]